MKTINPELRAPVHCACPGARKGWKFNLAVAVAITFGNGDIREQQPVTGLPSYYSDSDGPLIDGLQRYDNFVKWAEKGYLVEQFYDLSAWHMTHVVNARVSDEELVWARQNAKSWFQNAGKIGDLVSEMVKEKKMRLSVEYTDLEAFYSTDWVTLDDIRRHGGGCGAISQFGMAMVQAHGLPAVLLDTPKKVCYAWYKNGKEWVVCGSSSFNIKDWKDAKLPNQWCDFEDWEPGTTILTMQGHQADLQTWTGIHKAQIITSIMNSEWQLPKKLSPFQEEITTLIETIDCRAFYNVEGRIASDFDDLFGDNPGYTIAKELAFVPPKLGSETGTLDPIITFEKTSINVRFEHLTEVRTLEMGWKKAKYAPHQLEISYKLQGKTVLTTTKVGDVPHGLVDSVEINMTFAEKQFDIYKIEGLIFKGISYPPLKLLVGLAEQRLACNNLAKICLRLILEKC